MSFIYLFFFRSKENELNSWKKQGPRWRQCVTFASEVSPIFFLIKKPSLLLHEYGCYFCSYLYNYPLLHYSNNFIRNGLV